MKPIKVYHFDPGLELGIAVPNYMKIVGATATSITLEGHPPDTPTRRGQRVRVEFTVDGAVGTGDWLHRTCKVGRAGEALRRDPWANPPAAKWTKYGNGGWRLTERILREMAEGTI